MRSGVSKVACGAAHFLMLTENGLVLAAGENQYGQCTTTKTEVGLMEISIRDMTVRSS
jgi:alpha-tubulin suppressor-like RCC1 family protein